MNRTMTVAQLSSYLSGVFDDEELLHDVTLSGEVAEVSYSERHTFLVLAEGDYSVRCVHFSSRDRVEKGERVALRGSVDFYDKRNTVSFVYSEMFTVGAGEKNAKLLAVKQKLYELGYFENRPKLPKYITDVVAVTAPDGAAIRDFLRVVSAYPFVRVHVYPTKVQGEGAAERIRRAVIDLQSVKTDAIVLCRGGGSDEDLDTFNDEALAVAVAQSAIPVISAIGHEVDYTLCDFCSGTRAGTPSIAGEMVNSRAAALVSDIMSLSDRAYRALQNIITSGTAEVLRCGHDLYNAVSRSLDMGAHKTEVLMRRGYYAVEKKMEAASAALSVCSRLGTACERLIERKSLRTEKLNAVLHALDPVKIKSGCATVTLGGKRVSSISELSVGDEVLINFTDGNAVAKIGKTEKGAYNVG